MLCEYRAAVCTYCKHQSCMKGNSRKLMLFCDQSDYFVYILSDGMFHGLCNCSNISFFLLQGNKEIAT